jgi:hypothetical protein
MLFGALQVLFDNIFIWQILFHSSNKNQGIEKGV